MKASRIRLIVAALMLTGWFGYLGYLALALSPAVTVSRSQMLNATHVIKANSDANGLRDRQLLIGEVLPAGFTVENMADARLTGNKAVPPGSTLILPLRRTGPAQFQVVSLPGGARVPTVYLWSPDAERQAREQFLEVR